MLIVVDKLVTSRAVVPGCFLIYINWVVVVVLCPGQIPQTWVVFQAMDSDLMAVVTGLTSTSQEVRGTPAVSQGWNWLGQPCNASPRPPTSSFLSHHPLCPSVQFFSLPGATVSPKIPSAVVWGRATRGQTALEDDWSTTTIGRSSPWKMHPTVEDTGASWRESERTGEEGVKQEGRGRDEEKPWMEGIEVERKGLGIFYCAWGKTGIESG